jgi:predicted esterase
MNRHLLRINMRTLATAGCVTLALSAGAPVASSVTQDKWVPRHLEPVKLSEDVADLPSLDINVDKDENKRVFLIGLEEGAKAPRGGYGLIVVMPGGDGGPGFASFVHRLHQNSAPDDYLTLQMIAPEWKEGQKQIWSLERNRVTGAKFSTEEFVSDAIKEVGSRTKLNKKKILTLSWSSGGPAAYSLSLQKKTPIKGSLIRASGFYPDRFPSLTRAKGHRYYLMQSPTDEITEFHHAETARDALEKKGAKVNLVSYEGGHGWRGNFWPQIKSGFEWLVDG